MRASFGPHGWPQPQSLGSNLSHPSRHVIARMDATSAAGPRPADGHASRAQVYTLRFRYRRSGHGDRLPRPAFFPTGLQGGRPVAWKLASGPIARDPPKRAVLPRPSGKAPRRQADARFIFEAMPKETDLAAHEGRHKGDKRPVRTSSSSVRDGTYRRCRTWPITIDRPVAPIAAGCRQRSSSPATGPNRPGDRPNRAIRSLPGAASPSPRRTNIILRQ